MKKYLFILIALLFSAFPVYATDVDTKDGSAFTTTSDADGSTDSHDVADGQTIKSGGEVYADVTFYWGCENTTAEKSDGDSSATAVSSVAINSGDSPPVGTNSVDCPGGEDNYTFDISSDDIVTCASEGRVGFYFRLETFWNDAPLWAARYDADNEIRIKLDDDTDVVLTYEANNVRATAVWNNTVIGTGTWYFVEAKWNITTDVYQIRVDNGTWEEDDAATPTAFATTPNVLHIGNYEATKPADLRIDQVMISSDEDRDLYALRDETSF